ncbi:MAG: hypothetical protein PHR06_09365, partial [Candidatus Cloacimonetes bacterium]|nr:hypothetical protein [Candidatus Cloacimonadota bacterium]
DLIIYAVAFLLSFLVINGIMFLLMKGRIKQQIVAADSTSIAVDSLAVEEIPDVATLEKPEESIPDPVVEFRQLRKLKKELIEVRTGEKAYTQSDIDSILQKAVQNVDELITNQERYINEINRLNRKIDEQQPLITEIQKKNSELEYTIAKLKQDHKDELESLKKIEAEEAITYLAGTYDTMDPKEVAKLLLPLEDKKIIEILKKMNQRKLGKVLAEMPQSRSSQIVRKMTN